jgi:16S rRNA (adenine1518-N6/adenine1519-N6)-dimethyltransferase
VLEIGPGLGPLTELLVAEARSVLAIEKDARLSAFLAERFRHADTLKLLHADALQYVREHREWHGWKMVSNLPYSVASPILVELAQGMPGPDRMVVTLQEEVTRRIAAKAGEPDYGVLSLLLQLHYAPQNAFRIPATCFHPAPEVDSACLVLERRPSALLEPGRARLFNGLVKRAFSQRRKMMGKLLKQDWAAHRVERAFDEVGISLQARAEEVTLEQFVRLTERLAPSSTAT